MYRPVVWSIWASIRKMARMAVSRSARAGCSAGNSRSCCSTSGEALNSTQSCSLALTVMEDWVRAVTRMLPLR
jgi:hypothetical protein